LDILRTIAELRRRTSVWCKTGERVGLVPTMGALHHGHLGLVRAARAQCDRVVATIFVNPKQFAPGEDLEAYPRREAADLAMLRAAGVDLLFMPAVAEIYPPGFATTVRVEGLTECLCGAHRPGHFDGVATVVTKLLLQSLPDIAYFGEKDYQQLAIITKISGKLFPRLSIVPCPTVREKDGLAMSSRNALLDAASRVQAPVISQMLFQVEELKNEMSVPELKKLVSEKINSASLMQLEYFEIANENNLQPLNVINKNARAFIAVWAGKVRLIDNLSLNF